jgi:PAS domain S-box-containing protein
MESESKGIWSPANVLKSVGDAVIAADTGGRVKFMNPAAEALTGWKQQEAVGKDVMQVFPIVLEDTHLPVESVQVLREGVAANLPMHTLLIAHDGTSIPIVGSAAPIRDDEGNIAGVVLAFHDNSEQRQAQQALQETFKKVEQAKREWEWALDALPDLVCLVDDQGYLIRSNRAVEAWHLGRVEDVKGGALHELLHPQCANPDCYLSSLLKQVAEKTEGQLVKQEALDPFLKRCVLVSICPVLDRNQSPTHTAVMVMQDITVRKQVEQERERLIEELDAFAHTVAHDLRNPVGLIIGFAELEQDSDATPSDDLRQSLQVIARVGHKMNSIIEELLLLADVRQTQVEAKPLDMAGIVAEVQLRLTDMIQEHKAEIVMQRPDAWPVALGHAPWVEEVWTNYISNGIKYGGRPPRLALGATAQDDGMVRFWIRDNGPGLTPEDQSRVFIPFTRLAQARATGHGLGLSIVRRIVERLGGQVGVESEGLPGRGSVFYFTLPGSNPPAP